MQLSKPETTRDDKMSKLELFWGKKVCQLLSIALTNKSFKVFKLAFLTRLWTEGKVRPIKLHIMILLKDH